MSLNISYIIISLIFIALIIEDFKTKYIDIRLCILLFISVIFNVYVNEMCGTGTTRRARRNR